MAAFVHCKRGASASSRGTEARRKQTVGAGEEGRTQAQDLAAEIDRQLEEERAREESEFLDWHSPGAALPIDRALRDWLFHYGPTVGRSTLDRYRSLVDHQLVPYFGGKDLGALRDTDVIGFASSQYRAGAARDPVLNALSCLRRVIHLALEKGHLAQHPLSRMLRIAKQVARAQGRATVRAAAWTKEEASILLDLAREHEPYLFPLLSFAFLTGVRKGEAIGLRWSAVHLEQGTIEILWAISHGEGGPPKWGKNRTIQLPDALMSMLEELRGRRARRGKASTRDDWVFLPAGRGRRRKIGERQWPPHQLGCSCRRSTAATRAGRATALGPRGRHGRRQGRYGLYATSPWPPRTATSSSAENASTLIGSAGMERGGDGRGRPGMSGSPGGSQG